MGSETLTRNNPLKKIPLKPMVLKCLFVNSCQSMIILLDHGEMRKLGQYVFIITLKSFNIIIVRSFSLSFFLGIDSFIK